eukprot:m.277316 g.277316  ORF g.277316 m.277316 type:complete len:231 (-) comp19781_c0_seq22:1718-2410(-)
MQRVKRKNRGDLGEERIMPKLVKERPPPKKIREKQKDQAKKEFIRKVAEDASWEDNRPKKKHEKKREEQELKRDVILAKKFERKQLEAEEDEAIQASKAKTPKRTVYDIQRARDAAEQERLRANKQKALVRANITIESDYHAQLDAGNGNKDPTVHEGSGIDGALSAVTGVARQIVAPELSGKVTYKMFEEAQMPQYKENKPGLKASQYRDLIRKEWQRSSLNPNNQKAT